MLPLTGMMPPGMFPQFAGLHNPGLLHNPMLGGMPNLMNPAGLPPMPGMFPGMGGLPMHGMPVAPPQVPGESQTTSHPAETEGSKQ